MAFRDLPFPTLPSVCVVGARGGSLQVVGHGARRVEVMDCRPFLVGESLNGVLSSDSSDGCARALVGLAPLSTVASLFSCSCFLFLLPVMVAGKAFMMMSFRSSLEVASSHKLKT